jgi:FkbM family methyltransferase
MIQKFLKRHLPPRLVNYLRRIKGLTRSERDENFLAEAHRYRLVEPELDLICRNLAKDAVCIDVGGNIGLFAHHLCEACPQGVVHSFEPRHDLLARLQKNLSAFTNFRSHNFALTDQETTLEVTLDPSHGNSTVEHFTGAQGLKRQKIHAISLDAFVQRQNLKRLDFLKIDVEGHEVKVLAGAQKTIQQLRPIILCESENRHLRPLHHRVEDLIARVMESFNYRCFYLREGVLAPYDAAMVPQDKVPGRPYVYNWLLVPAEKTLTN